MVWPCSCATSGDTGIGRLSNGAPPCPTNQIRPLPQWASILAKIRSTLSASISAARSRFDRSGYPARSKCSSRPTSVPDRNGGMRWCAHHAIASNRENEVAQATMEWYRKRGDASENRIKDLMIGFGREYMPCGTFEANAVFFAISVLTYNLYLGFRGQARTTHPLRQNQRPEQPPRGSTKRRRPPCDAKRSDNQRSDPRPSVARNPISDFGMRRPVAFLSYCVYSMLLQFCHIPGFSVDEVSSFSIIRLWKTGFGAPRVWRLAVLLALPSFRVA